MPALPPDPPPDHPTLEPGVPTRNGDDVGETLMPPPGAEPPAPPPASGRPAGDGRTVPQFGTGVPAGLAVPGHELLGELGRGGMGVVYKARHVGLGRVVAVKMILAGEFAGNEHRRRFLIEATAVARLQHPNVVQIYEHGEADGRPFFSLEFVDGGSLELALRGTPQPPRRAAELVETLARAMHYAHGKGVVHRDLKPANVLLAADGSPKITDFGLAKQLESDGPSADGAVMGTPSYMAPEQATGEVRRVGPAADVYALGAILYELLTGRPPFRGTTLLETLEQVRSADPVPPERLQAKAPRDLVTVCMKCLRKEPEKRYASALELADDLRRFLDGEPVLARPTPAWERAVKWARRRPAVAALGAAGVLIVVLGFAAVAWQWRAAAAEARTLAAVGAEERERARAEAAENATLSARREEDRQRRQAREALYSRSLAFAERRWQDGDTAAAEAGLAESPADLRRWEWHHLKRRLGAGRTAFVADGHVDYLAFSPDGSAFATGGGRPLAKDPPAAVKVWDAATGQLRLTIPGRDKDHPDGHAGVVSQVCFSPDGRLLACASAQIDVPRIYRTGRLPDDLVTGEVKVWDAVTGKHLWDVPGVAAVTFSPDGRRLAFGTADRRVRVWDVATRADAVEPLPPRPGWAVQLAFSPDARSLAAKHWFSSAAKPGLPESVWELTVWDAATGRLRFARDGLKIHGANPFTPDGSRLAARAADGAVKLVDARDGRDVLSLRGRGKQAGPVAFSPDGTLLAAASDRLITVWDAAAGEELYTLRGHAAAVEGLAFAPAGRGPACPLASGDGNGTVNLWDPAAGPGERTLAGHDRPGTVSGVAFSPDGRSLAETNPDAATVNLWDTGSWQIRRRIRGVCALAVAFSADGRWLAVCHGDGVNTARPGALLLYDLRDDRAPRREFTDHTRFVTCVAFSPDGRYLASSSVDGRGRRPGEVIVRAADTRAVRWRLPLKERVFALAFSPDGRQLAVAAAGAAVRLYDAAGGTIARSLEGEPGDYDRVAFSPAGGWVAAGTDDGVVKVWDAGSGREALTIRAHSGAVMGLAFSPDGERLASASFAAEAGEGELVLWDARAGTELLRLPGQTCVAFAPDGRHLAAAAKAALTVPGAVRVWDATPSPEVFSVRSGEGGADAAAYGPDGKLLVTGHAAGVVVVRDADTGRVRRSFRAHESEISRVTFSPDGTRFATGCFGGGVKVWDAATGAEVCGPAGLAALVFGLAFSPDGRRLAGASRDGTARVWDAADGKPLHTLKHPGMVFDVRYSPDGKRLATACQDGWVRLWDAGRGTPIREWRAHRGPARALAFSPDGRALASAGADRSVRLWDLASGRERPLPGSVPAPVTAGAALACLLSGGPGAPLQSSALFGAGRPPRHAGAVYRLAFRPDGRRLASAGADRVVRVWDLEDDGGPVILAGHADGIFDLAFSPDGCRLASASFDGSVKVWQVATPADKRPADAERLAGRAGAL